MVDEVKETQNDGEKPQEETGEENNYILPDEAYKVLKWLALIALPALAVFVHVVGPAWNLPCVDQIVTTLTLWPCWLALCWRQRVEGPVFRVETFHFSNMMLEKCKNTMPN